MEDSKDIAISRQAAIEIVDFECGGELIGTAKIITKRLSDLPSAQPEQSESEDITFWKKRAREYEEMVLKLTDEMARGIKINSVLITEEGIVFKKEKSKQRWIPVTEQLPAYGEDVLISIGGYCNVGHIVSVNEEEKYNWYFSGWYHSPNDVDAWMPLPEPYRKEGKADG